MKKNKEIKNLNRTFRNPQNDYEITLKIDLGDSSKEIMQKIKTVAKIIMENLDADWDDEEYFHQILPQWVSENIKSYTAEECEELMAAIPKAQWDTALPWDFGSWLFMLGERAWIWQGCYIDGNYAEIYLNTMEMAETGSTLQELVRAAGGKVIGLCHFLWSEKEDVEKN